MPIQRSVLVCTSVRALLALDAVTSLAQPASQYYGGPASGTAVTLTSFTAVAERAVVNMAQWLGIALLVVALVTGIPSRRCASHRRDIQTTKGGIL